MISRRHFLRSAAAMLAYGALPAGAAAIDPRALVDPELRDAMNVMLAYPLPPVVANPTVEQMVELRKKLHQSKPFKDAPPVTEAMVDVPGGPPVKVYVVNAEAGKNRPAILHMHGGGLILGTAKDYVYSVQDLARELDCVAVTVEYRLSPEAKFPAALDDGYAALKWLHANAKTLGADPARIALIGGSAGGGLAAMLAIAARNRAEVPVIFQALVYPMLDDRTGSTRDPAAHLGTFGWNREYNKLGWTSFLGVPAGSASVPAGAVPAREADLAGLPPAWIGVGTLDLFVDEDIEYAKRLVDAGVPTELYVAPGAFHGFDFDVPGARISKAFRASMIAAMRNAFGTAVTPKT